MSYRILLAAAALNGTVFGLLFIAVPDLAISLFGGRLDALSSLLVRQFGGVILGIAIFDWMLRLHEERSVRRAVVVANVTAFAVVATVATYATVTGTLNWLGWVVAVFHAVVAAGLTLTYLTSASSTVPEQAMTSG